MNFFPYDSASWEAATGAIYMGANGSLPMIATIVCVVGCVWALWAGNRKEHRLYKSYRDE